MVKRVILSVSLPQFFEVLKIDKSDKNNNGESIPYLINGVAETG